jgi:hypothetical protein
MYCSEARTNHRGNCRYVDAWNRHDKKPSQPNEKTRNVLDATQALEIVAIILVKALFNIRGERIPSGKKGYSLKEFD